MLDSENPTSPEHELICSIIQQAVLDLFNDLPGEHLDARARTRKDAIQFCTSTTRTWARSRHDLCIAVGLDPDAMRERIVQALEGGDNLDSSLTKPAHRANLDESRAIYRELKAPPPMVKPKPKSTPLKVKKPEPAEPTELDELLEITRARPKHTPFSGFTTSQQRVLARRMARIERICELIDMGLTQQEMVELEGVHETTIHDRIKEAIAEGHVRRIAVGVYTTVPQTALAACG